MVGWGTHRYQSDITEPTGITCTQPKPYTPDAALPQTAPLSFKLSTETTSTSMDELLACLPLL